MTDLVTTGAIRRPLIEDATDMPMPDDIGWTWVDFGILAWLFGGAVALPFSLMLWGLT